VLRAAFAALASGSAGAGGSAAAAQAGLGTPLVNTPAGSPSTTGGTSTGASTQSTTPVTAAAQPSTGGFIQADPATNSLIISAAEPLDRQLRSMIDQLDQRRAQVYIESMIVEVSGGDAADFGFEWAALSSKDNSLNAVQTMPQGTNPNIVSINAGLASTPAVVTVGNGLTVGLVRMIDGVKSLAAVLRLLQTRAQTRKPRSWWARTCPSSPASSPTPAPAPPTRSRPSSARTWASRCASSRRSARTAPSECSCTRSRAR
jgi:general secretion pathway protein D